MRALLVSSSGRHPLAIGGVVLKDRNVAVQILDLPPGAGPTGLKAGAPGEDDHQVATEILRDFCLADAQTFSGGDHQHDRDDAPGDSEHGERCAQLVRPERLENVADEVAQNHEKAARKLDEGPLQK